MSIDYNRGESYAREIGVAGTTTQVGMGMPRQAPKPKSLRDQVEEVRQVLLAVDNDATYIKAYLFGAMSEELQEARKEPIGLEAQLDSLFDLARSIHFTTRDIQAKLAGN